MKLVYMGDSKSFAWNSIKFEIKENGTASVVKLVYTMDSKSISFGSVGSTPTTGTNSMKNKVFTVLYADLMSVFLCLKFSFFTTK
jgi:hypothetical protein